MSKGLEALERIGKCYVNSESKDLMFTDNYGNDYDIIEKELKALEILKEKRVNIGCFYHVVFVLKKDYESCKLNNNNIMYNICDTEKEFLTPEEFDLLKEVLG